MKNLFKKMLHCSLITMLVITPTVLTATTFKEVVFELLYGLDKGARYCSHGFKKFTSFTLKTTRDLSLTVTFIAMPCLAASSYHLYKVLSPAQMNQAAHMVWKGMYSHINEYEEKIVESAYASLYASPATPLFLISGIALVGGFVTWVISKNLLSEFKSPARENNRKNSDD